MKKLEKIRISNFRGFDNLLLSDLSNVNVLVGANDVGKTSILESIFMLIGINNPWVPSRMNYLRSFSELNISSMKYLFHNVNFQNKPLLSALVNGKTRQVEISAVTKSLLDEPMKGSAYTSNDLSALTFDFDNDYKEDRKYRYHSKLYVDVNGNSQVSFDMNFSETYNCLYIPSDRNDNNMIQNFSTLVKRNQKQAVVDAMRVFDSSIESIEALPDGLYLKISGVEELLPVAMAGDGVRRAINVISTIANEDYDVVMIDELDNGLHYSAQKLVWKTILAFIKQQDKQLFVTTHNMDCLLGLQNALENDESLRGLANIYNVAKTKNAGFQSFRYTYNEFKAAIDSEIEIRR